MCKNRSEARSVHLTGFCKHNFWKLGCIFVAAGAMWVAFAVWVFSVVAECGNPPRPALEAKCP